MKKKLRDYQSTALDALSLYWRTGGGNALIVMPTASGKSLVIAELCFYLLTKFPLMRLLVVTHSKELIEQNYRELKDYWPDAPAGIYSAGLDRRETGHRITFAGIQSIFSRPDILGAIDLIVIDECHLISRNNKSMYGRLLVALKHRVPDMRIVGFTATPFRLDSGSLMQGKGKLFDTIVYQASIRELMEAGYIATARLVATNVGIEVGGVGLHHGEFVQGELEQAAVAGDNVVQACAELVRLAVDRKSILVFCCGVDHAVQVRDRLRELEVSCEAVWGTMNPVERDSVVQAFRQGDIRCVINVDVLSTGYNAPNIDCIVMMRPTMSPGLYIQQVGRGFRIADGKADLMVLDFAGNVKRHGPVDDPNIGTVKQEAGEKAKECQVCGTLNGVMARACSWCEAEFPSADAGTRNAPVRKPNHLAYAEGGALFAAGYEPVQGVTVTDWSFRRHQKPGKPDSLRVLYRSGLLGYSEWVCFEHFGAQAWRAKEWWEKLGGKAPAPATVAEALNRTSELTMPSSIQVRRNGEYWQVVGHQFRKHAA